MHHAVHSNLRLCRPATTDRFQHHLLRHFKSNPDLITSTERKRNPNQEIDPSNPSCIELHHFGRALNACVDTHDLRKATAFHTQLIKLHSDCPISLWNRILNVYCQLGEIGHAHQVFNKMPRRDVVSFNMLISACARQNHDVVEALHIYSSMQGENVSPNHITLAALLRGRASYGAGHLMEQIHAHAILYGLNFNEYVGSSLVDGYAKRKSLESAMRAFDEIAVLDLVSWNVLIEGCVSNGSEEQAFRVFDRMRQEDVGFDCFTLTSVLKMCSEPKALNQGMQLHGCVVKAGFASETPIGNALITMYSKCEEGMESAAKLFPRISTPNIISWTAMISGYMQNDLNEEAIVFYREMLRHGVKENEFSFASILPAYTSLASIEQGRQVHARIAKSQFSSDVSVGNALLDMYFKCGILADAEFMFATMEKRDLVSWTVMIAGFGQHGKGRDALLTFEAMKREGLQPDAITFLGCLSACSHGGLVDEGLQIFRSMIDGYGIKPKREHYACVVDVLGRAGRLKDAERFIEDMGIASDVLVWEALLSACRIHGEIELGERSARKIMEPEPEKEGPYVQLSNIYAEKGMWEEKRKVRRRLDASGLRKEAGRSWVAVQGRFGSLQDEMKVSG
ncbi:hypothetical protein MRB53_017033 [Persea americana]|uniref:Uncharacterized protein n=1 Tax=Persea americana TaxID=3435 RepID=A0ACC2M416_PERAE|nr:hypothetical protein MRB53_017033 [Persea americana]